jgi:hypothetical protein
MIRKGLIMVLTLATVGTGLVCCRSYFRPSRNGHFYEHSGEVQGVVDLVHVYLSPTPERLGPTKFRFAAFNVVDGTVDVVDSVGGSVPNIFDYPTQSIGPFKLCSTEVATPPGSTARCYGFRLRVPLWFPAALFAGYPTVAFIRGPLRRYRRRRRGLCLKCGYDLTGNVSGTCPECGAEVKQP